MGTRGLTVVAHEGKYKVAQYGQWDHYPSGQGLDILEFLRERDGVERLKSNLSKVYFAGDDDVQNMLENARIQTNDGWLDCDNSAKLKALFPTLSRDTGGGILRVVADHQGERIPLRDSIEFAGDSLFCEWAYVVDFDANTFEVYEGYNKEPVPTEGRFAGHQMAAGAGETVYHPVKKIASWPLDGLPTRSEFLRECKDESADDKTGA